jgi:hypothetical protein
MVTLFAFSIRGEHALRAYALPLCVHGNPNVLTRDVGTSALAQGCTGQLTTVEVERFDGNLPPIQAYDPPISLTSVDRDRSMQ